MKRLPLLLTFSFLLASPALAGEVLIPVAYRGAGANGTLWKTEIVVANLSPHNAAPRPVTIAFHRDNGETDEITTPLTPGEVLAVPDAVFSWFGVENGGGIVLVAWEDAPNVRFTARARVYNAGAHGEYGQSVPGLDTWKLVSDNYLPGLSGVDGNRTNVGVANPYASPQIAWIELIDTTGESRGAFAATIPARSFRQFNDIFSYFETGPLHAAMVRVSGMSMPIYAYASIVRNDTGDATFVMQP